jgi:hypothetical protein
MYNANPWKQTWDNTEQNINEKLHIEMTKKYQQQNQKLKNLKEHQTQKIENKQQFHPKIRNLTDIHFIEKETTLISKGLKYNLHYKRNNWIRTLAIEAETAISYMKETEQNYSRHAVAKSITQLFR